ncbi:MAG: hypothetical protein EBS51_10150 [Planctomycetia bacterium]|nr:hypothetical protein [Planctomycetia bacterium]
MSRAVVHQAGAVLVSLLAFVAGCGKAADGFSGQRGKVSGKATLAGEPLPAGCQVLFIAKQGGYTASGPVGADGTFAIEYQVPQGLPVGDYVVQISPPATTTAAAPVDPAEMARKMTLSADAKPASTLPFPERYASTSTSGLAFTVQPGANTFELSLKK